MKRKQTLEERVWARVDRSAGEDACWPWLGSRARGGYGVISVDGRPTRATRLLWAMHHKIEFPAHLDACHTCDNPPCVNPRHIWPGTAADNARDAMRKGRLKMPEDPGWQRRKTHCKQGHALDEGNTIIKRDGHRNCRICQLISGRKYDNATRGRHRAPLPGGAQRGNVKERFGERIRRLRTEQKLGLRKFATKVGISPTYLSRIETSKDKAPPAEDVIRKMAIQLPDSFDELMTLAGRVSEESLNVIKADPGMPEFLRAVGERKLSAEDLMKLLPYEPKKGER